MANIEKDNSAVALPHGLERKLVDFRRSLQERSVTEWILLGFAILLFFAFILFIWDRIIPISPVFRFILFLCGLSGFLALGPYLFYHRVGRFKTNKDLTFLIKKHLPRFGERLQGCLELRKQDASEAHFSVELSNAAMRQIATEAEKIEFKQALPKTWRPALIWILIILTALVITGFSLARNQTQNALARYFLPLGNIPRYTAIRFHEVPKTVYVAKEEESTFSIKLKNSEQISSIPQATAKLAGHPTLRASYEEEYSFSLPSLNKPSKLILQAGDAFESIEAIPVSRPRIQNTTVYQSLPQYLQLPPRKYPAEGSTLSLLEGSNVELEIRTNNPLESVKSNQEVSFKAQQNSARSSNFLITDEIKPVTLSILDSYGMSSAIPIKYKIKPVEDTAPKVLLTTTGKEVILLPHETLNLALSAKDDFGIKNLSLTWHPKDQEQRISNQLIAKGTPELSLLRNNYALNPSILKISPNTYSVYAEASDYHPTRNPGTSKPFTLHLLSLEEHSEQLRLKFSSLLNSLDQTYLKEVALYQQNLLLTRETDDSDYKQKEQLEKNISEERDQIKRLKEERIQTLALLQDSFRNIQIHRSIKRIMANLSGELNTLTKANLPEVLGLLEGISNTPLSDELQTQELSHAVILHKEALDKLRTSIETARSIEKY